MNSIPVKQSNNEIKSETNLENNNDLFLKTNVTQNIQEFYWQNDTNQSPKVSSSSNKAISHTSQSKILSPSIIIKEKQMPSLSPYFQSSNDENEIENSLNDVTDHLSQQDIITSNINIDKSFHIPSRDSNKTKLTLSSLKTIDEASQHSIVSVSFDIHFRHLVSNKNSSRNIHENYIQ
jgi:hypothetical protein